MIRHPLATNFQRRGRATFPPRGVPIPPDHSIRQSASMLQRLVLVLSLCAASAGVAFAQSPSAAPYDRDLQRLSEIMGALHYLRAVCGAKEGQVWRDEIQKLIDAEAPSGERRDRMVASFNRGYRGFQQTYRTCTPAATVAIRRYLDEGGRIARDITARYAN
jgi:uncharacterized protein (TIGR02301 family)